MTSPSRAQMARTRVKVCGITTVADARLAEEAGADAVGLIFVPGSPRYMGNRLQAAREIALALGPYVTRVAVVRCISDFLLLPGGLFDAVQYYEDDLAVGHPVPARRVRAFRLGAPGSPLPNLAEDGALLVDAYDPERLGGTGMTADWSGARRLRDGASVPMILAGGLKPDNVGAALSAVRPYAVDVSSGVEAGPGVKDPARIRAFMDAVRHADTAHMLVPEGGDK